MSGQFDYINQYQPTWTGQQGTATGNIQFIENQSDYYLEAQRQQLIAMMDKQRKDSMISGDKPLVVCGTETVTCKDMDEAQAKAEELAHKLSQTAYILKPIRKVAPKRDVVTTDL